MQVGGFTHRQAGQVGDSASGSAGHGDGQDAVGAGLVDDQQDLSVGIELVEQGGGLRFVLGQGLVVQLRAVGE